MYNEHSKKCLAPSARRRRILTEGRLHAEKTRKLARVRVPDGREISPGGPELLLKEEFLMKKSLVLAMAMALGVSATAFAANPFSDVPAGH